MSNYSGRILSDYESSQSTPVHQSVPKGLESSVPFRDRSHPNVAEVRGTGNKMRYEPASASTNSPFNVSLLNIGTSESPAWAVTVAPGQVCEVIPGLTDALKYHEPENIWDGDDLRRFDIAEGEAVFVVVNVLADGTVGIDGEAEDVSVQVAEDGSLPSIHYQPKVDTESPDGAIGVLYYKLAVLDPPEVVDGPPILRDVLSGSHIYYYQELPSLLSTRAVGTGIGVIPYEWNNLARCYKLRAISNGLGKLDILTVGDAVEVRGNRRGLHIEIYEADNASASDEVLFDDGLCASGTVIEDADEPDGLEREKVIIPIPIVEPDPHADTQIHVNPVNGVAGAGKGRRFQVRGNSKTGSLSITVDGGSPQTISWKDGLMTTEGDTPVDIVFPDPGGDGLPTGTVGQMLYHNGTAWVVLANPGAPSAGTKWVQTHTGTAPEWVLYDEVEVDVCIDGTPTAYKFLGTPVT